MKLSGLHLLLTYQCTSECDHCFVWGNPRNSGAMTLDDIRCIVDQAAGLNSVEWIYFEGGEPFLFHPILVAGVRLAAQAGFKVGIVTNAYWATTVEDAHEWLCPFSGRLDQLSVSGDRYHGNDDSGGPAENARTAAERLGIPNGIITVAQPGSVDTQGVAALTYRGRASQRLVHLAPSRPWSEFDACPHEDLRDPGRVHVDPMGHVHICQGISIGNLFETPLQEICDAFDPDSHPILEPLLAGGPAELTGRYGVGHEPGYADACHLCCDTRALLRDRFSRELAPDAVYGVEPGSQS